MQDSSKSPSIEGLFTLLARIDLHGNPLRSPIASTSPCLSPPFAPRLPLATRGQPRFPNAYKTAGRVSQRFLGFLLDHFISSWDSIHQVAARDGDALRKFTMPLRRPFRRKSVCHPSAVQTGLSRCGKENSRTFETLRFRIKARYGSDVSFE